MTKTLHQRLGAAAVVLATALLAFAAAFVPTAWADGDDAEPATYNYKLEFNWDNTRIGYPNDYIKSAIRDYLGSRYVDCNITAGVTKWTANVTCQGELTYKEVQGVGAMFEDAYYAISEAIPHSTDHFIGIGRKGVSGYKNTAEFKAEQVDETLVPKDETVQLYVLEAGFAPTVDVTVAAPVCGDKIAYADKGPELPTGAQPKVILPADALYSVYVVDGTDFTFWHAENLDYLAAGTVLEGGKTYAAALTLVPAFGYYFDDYTAQNVTFNGGDALKAEYSDLDGGVLEIYGSVEAVHSWDNGKITTKPTLKKTGVKTYTCKGGDTRTEVVAKLKANTMTVKAKTGTVKFSKLKKKAQTLNVAKVLKVKNAKGAVTYAKKSGNKKITINKKTGKVTVKKGLKKGTYKVKVKVTAAGDDTYAALSKTVKIKVKVK